jgi:hypothetical protein
MLASKMAFWTDKSAKINKHEALNPKHETNSNS